MIDSAIDHIPQKSQYFYGLEEGTWKPGRHLSSVAV